MRRHDDRVDAEQGRVGGRFGGEHVERRSGHGAVADRLGEGRLVDDPAAGDVDDAQAGLCLEQQVTPDQPGGLGGLRKVDGEEVRLGDHLFERHQLDAADARTFGRDVRVEGDEAHAETAGTVGDELADAAEADDPQRLVGELDTLPPAALPATVDEGGVRLRDVAGLGEQQRHRVLGGGHGIRLGGVDHHDTAGGGALEVDVVEADPGAADDHQAVGGGEQFGVDRGRRADDQRLGTGDLAEQFGARQLAPHVDGVAGRAETLQPALGDLFGDEDARHAEMHTGRRLRSPPVER